MKNEVYISYYLDTRREKQNKKYPVRLRVFTPAPRKQKLYPTKFEFTKDEFSSVWETTKPRIENKELRRVMQTELNHADSIASKISPFTFEIFEKKLFRLSKEGSNVLYHYEQAIQTLLSNGQISTASNYGLSRKSLLSFIEHEKGKAPSSILFHDITSDFLRRYEYHLVNNLNQSRTTVSIYLRVLRTIFNNAIKENDIEKVVYPFGKDKYKVPSVQNVKKAFSKEELKVLFDAQPQTPEQEKAKDFWFLSYACYGMNIKDIAQLKFKDLDKNSFKYYRAKTINTNKGELKPITVELNEYTKGIIEKYKNKSEAPEDYVFSIIDKHDTNVTKYKKIKNFTSFINQAMKKLAKNNGVTGEISTYWARHSFAFNAILEGASMELISEVLNHSDMKTTIGYFKGFPSEMKKSLANKIMNF
jgi:integrase/recombinase XerD